MRQLFLPACVCLVTWSGATGSDPRFSLEEFTGAPAALKKSFAQKPAAETTGSSVEKVWQPELAAATVGPELLADAIVLEIPDPANALADLAIEYPAPAGETAAAAQLESVPLPPVPKPVVTRSNEEICDTLTQAAHTNDLPVPFFIRLLFQESRFEAGSVSPAGAQGIAQFMPETAADVGLKNPFDPLQAIPASARLLRSLLTQFGNLGLAAAAYNAGPKRIQEWLQNKGKSKLPQETQGYVKTITGRPVENWSAAAARHPEQRLPRRAPCQQAAGLYAWNGPLGIPMPAPSPLRGSVTAAFKTASTAKPAGPHGGKANVETAAMQLAARRHKPKIAAKHKPEKIAQR